jgi:hypothetical protein
MSTTDQSASNVQDELTAANSELSDVVVVAAGVSILLALYEFYVRDNENRGIFVGHWAPTILAFATYLRRRRRED